MTKILMRWVGIWLISNAIMVVYVSTKIVDVPGPMESSKPEFTFQFSRPFAIPAIVAAFVGVIFVISSLRRKHNHVA